MPALGLGLGYGFGRKAWIPTKLVGIAPSLSVALQRFQGKLWQNTDKTDAATANNDPVRDAVPPWVGSGNDYAAGSDSVRPLLKVSGSQSWLAFDGVDDYLIGPAFPTYKYVLMGIRARSNVTASNYPTIFGSGEEGITIGFLQYPDRNEIYAAINGTGIEPLSDNGADGEWHTYTLIADATAIRLRTDGVESNSVSYTPITVTPSANMIVGCRGAIGGNAWPGDLAGAIAAFRTDAPYSDSDVTNLEADLDGLAS